MSDVTDHTETDVRARILTTAERLCQLLSTVHRMNSDRYVADAKMHDMVAVAMEEDWDVCRMHMEAIIATIATVVADGAASGEFRVADVNVAANCTCAAMVRF